MIYQCTDLLVTWIYLASSCCLPAEVSKGTRHAMRCLLNNLARDTSRQQHGRLVARYSMRWQIKRKVLGTSILRLTFETRWLSVDTYFNTRFCDFGAQRKGVNDRDVIVYLPLAGEIVLFARCRSFQECAKSQTNDMNETQSQNDQGVCRVRIVVCHKCEPTRL